MRNKSLIKSRPNVEGERNELREKSKNGETENRTAVEVKMKNKKRRRVWNGSVNSKRANHYTQSKLVFVWRVVIRSRP